MNCGLRLLSPEQLDPALTREIENMQRIIAGVEFDWTGRRVAYHVFPRQADLLVATQQWAPIRLPAEDILHLFEPKTPGQVRGTSWLAAVLTTICRLISFRTACLRERRRRHCSPHSSPIPSGTSGFGEAPAIRKNYRLSRASSESCRATRR